MIDCPVEEPAVVRYDKEDAGKRVEVLFESSECGDVEVVGWLIEKEDIGRAHQHE